MTNKYAEFLVACVLFAFCLAGFAGQKWAAVTACLWFLLYAASAIVHMRVARKEEHIHAHEEQSNTSITDVCSVDEHYIEELTEYIESSGIAHGREATVEEVIKSLLQYRKELLARLAEQSSGIHLRGWWCTRIVADKGYPCDTFNGEEHQLHSICRHCEQPKLNS